MDDANLRVSHATHESNVSTEAEISPLDNPVSDESAAELRIVGGDTVEPALPQIIEALIFSSDAPLSAARISELVGAGGVTQVRLAIAELNDKYAAAGLSFRVENIARGYQMMTLPAYQPWLAKLFKKSAETRLSPSALETLSIIAYKQPIIRADIESIRGVMCGDVINRLRDMDLVRTAGRAEVVGRPMLYGTTRKFLDVFGLADLSDLPALETLKFRPAPAPTAAVEPPAAPESAPEIRAVAGA